ncbi:hypothetical protein K445DRAFT_317260 [Daldinia sp. EC12]|nr:hypothetical protein K445DRAFT_317260 [Daldinia sp. EC12]
MPARFPYKPLMTAEASEPQPEPEIQPGCQLLVQKPGDRYVWALGDSYILKQRIYESGCEVEVLNADFVSGKLEQKQGISPIPETELYWREGDRFFAIQRRIEGNTLDKILGQLASGDIARIGHQVGQYILHFKTITSQYMARLDGRPVNDFRLFKPPPDPSYGEYSVCVSDNDL